MEMRMSDTASLPPNPGKQLTIDLDGATYARYPVRTKLVEAGDDVVSVVKDAVEAHLEAGDTVVVSEKIVAIAQGRAFPIDEIRPSFWARLLSRFVSKPGYGIGLGSPETMELALWEAGLPRILFAAAISFPLRAVGVRGLFYVIADKNIAAIDGPTPYTIPPYNRFAKLPPAEPDKVAREISMALGGAPAVIIDANDLGRRVLGASKGVNRKHVEKLFADNPLGQGAEQTPVALVRKEPA
jgi:F420-0:gamma-glutamyl ligase-like protein